MRRLLAVFALVLCSACDKEAEGTRKVPTARTVDARVQAANPKCRAICKISGRCTWEEKVQRCLATEPTDCRKSDTCRSSGLCTLEKEKCVGAAAEDCAASEQCRSAGACSFTGNPFEPCRPRTDADCGESQACKRHGRCHPAQDRCVVQTEADCRQAEVCRRDGACSFTVPTDEPSDTQSPHQAASSPGPRGALLRCEAANDADCAQSQACRKDGRCKAVDGYCR